MIAIGIYQAPNSLLILEISNKLYTWFAALTCGQMSRGFAFTVQHVHVSFGHDQPTNRQQSLGLNYE